MSNLTGKRQRGLLLQQMWRRGRQWRSGSEAAKTTCWGGEASGEGVGGGEEVADAGEVAVVDGSDGEADMAAKAEP